MGARPIATLNSLRFGKIENEKTQHLLSGVVSGIGHYGNCFGVPTVGGEIYFEECYHTNPLVNAMSAGVVRLGETVSATAPGKGNPVFIAGSATGKDGMGEQLLLLLILQKAVRKIYPPCRWVILSRKKNYWKLALK